MHKRPVAYYITAHGYGHGARSCDVIRALKRINPDLPVLLVSDLGEKFFQPRLGSNLMDGDNIRQAAFDVGMVQKDSILTDVDATLEKLLALCSRAETLIDEERRFLDHHDVGVVVCDIPGIPLVAAARAGIPGIAIGNFSWDWIYVPFMEREPRWSAIVDHFRACYAKADLLLRLPFAGDMSSFRNIEDLPLMASPGSCRRLELAQRFGADVNRSWVLLSFTSLNWEPSALARLNRLSDYELFSVLPLKFPDTHIHPVNPREYAFQDVIASVDVVLSKPGFGIVSECIVNRKPLIYADRADFIEYPILVEGIQRYLRHLHVPSERLYAGDIEEFLGAIGDQPDPSERLQTGGAEIAAQRIQSFNGE
jgi:L-arabinokinase